MGRHKIGHRFRASDCGLPTPLPFPAIHCRATNRRRTVQLQYDREELYKKGLGSSHDQGRRRVSVSSVALAKACRKLSVPIPGRGHWAKLAHGHRGDHKPPLPKLNKVLIVLICPLLSCRFGVSCFENDFRPGGHPCPLLENREKWGVRPSEPNVPPS